MDNFDNWQLCYLSLYRPFCKHMAAAARWARSFFGNFDVVHGPPLFRLYAGNRFGAVVDDQRIHCIVADAWGVTVGLGDGATICVAGDLFRLRSDVAFRSPHNPMDGLVYIRLIGHLRRSTVDHRTLVTGVGTDSRLLGRTTEHTEVPRGHACLFRSLSRKTLEMYCKGVQSLARSAASSHFPITRAELCDPLGSLWLKRLRLLSAAGHFSLGLAPK